jgi:hypothetical protein
VADAAPFTVSAPPNALLYFWTFPAGVTATDKGDSLEVTAAPKGTHSFTCKAITVDWTAKKATTAIHGVTVYVGTGPAPDPGPSPDFSAALKAAYDGQPNPAAVAPLASACRATAASVRGSSYPNWAGVFVDWDGKRPGKLSAVETAIWGEVVRRNPDASPLTNPITPAGRVAAAEVFESAAKVLDDLSPDDATAFTKAARAAFAQETPADKALVHDLAAVYRQAAKQSLRPEYATLGQLQDAVIAAGKDMIGPALPHVREVVAAELKTALGSNYGTALDDALRKTCETKFRSVAGSLDSLK